MSAPQKEHRDAARLVLRYLKGSINVHPIASMRSKHIDVQHHFVRERAAMGEVVFAYCTTAEMVADCMTKPLAVGKLLKCLGGMGVHG
jgi:hypothetical protein